MSKTPTWKIEDVALSKLKAAKYNPRTISDHDMANLKAAMARDGCLENIVINKDSTIISGHQRVKAAKELGWKKIPAVRIDVPKHYEKLLNIRMNRVRGEFDPGMLGSLIESIASNPKADLALSGLTDSEITEYLDATKEEIPEDADDVDEISANKVNVKRGDIIELGPHRIMCGDSTDPDQVAKLMDGQKARILFTDPPYNVDYHASVEYGEKQNIHRDNTTDYVHPTQKPTLLADKAIKKHTKAGDIVLDLFGGSGSTLIAAEHMGRKAYIMEYDPYYVETIRNRYNQFIKEQQDE